MKTCPCNIPRFLVVQIEKKKCSKFFISLIFLLKTLIVGTCYNCLMTIVRYMLIDTYEGFTMKYVNKTTTVSSQMFVRN